MPAMKAQTATAPMPMPAFAPVERLLLLEPESAAAAAAVDEVAAADDEDEEEEDDEDDDVDALEVVCGAEMSVDCVVVASPAMANVLEKVGPSTAVDVPEITVDSTWPMSTRGPNSINGSLEQSQVSAVTGSQQNVVLESKLEHRVRMLPVSVWKGSASQNLGQLSSVQVESVHVPRLNSHSVPKRMAHSWFEVHS